MPTRTATPPGYRYPAALAPPVDGGRQGRQNHGGLPWQGAASLERRVLLVSTDPAHSLADAFDREIGDRETDLAANLTGLEIDPDSEVDAHLERVRAQMACFAGADQRPELERQRASAANHRAQEAPAGAHYDDH